MPTCFVIQPFSTKFDKRFRDVYKPALEKAGLNSLWQKSIDRSRSEVDGVA